MAGSNGAQVAATWQGLAQIPQLMNEVRAGVLALRALISTPAAAVATGSPPASAAIVVLGAELAIFIAQTVQAIDDDIDGIEQVLQNYQRNEGELVSGAQSGMAALNSPTGGVVSAATLTPAAGTRSVVQGDEDRVAPVPAGGRR